MTEVESLDGVTLFTPPMACADPRGLMWAWFDPAAASQHPNVPYMRVGEATVAISNRGVIRGIHYAKGRAKYVTCLSGAIYDVAVDLRRGSPTFGSWVSHELNEENRHAVYIGEGFGHGHQTLERSTVAYLYSTPYIHEDYAAINPLDSAMGINWPYFTRFLSHKDAAAPLLSDAPWLPEYWGDS